MFITVLAGLLSLHNHVWELPISVVAAALIILPFLFTYAVTTVLSYLSFKNRSNGREPPSIPYVIPVLNNASFFWNVMRFMQSLVQKFNGTPILFKAGGNLIYFISGAENMQRLFNKSQDLSTKPWAIWAYHRVFGLPAADTDVLWADDSGALMKPAPGSLVEDKNRLWFKSHHNFTTNLKGPGLKGLTQQFKDNLALQLTGKNSNLSGEAWVELPDLFGFVKDTTFIASTNAFCGPHLLELNPTLVRDFWDFDASLLRYMSVIPAPRWLMPACYALRNRLHSGFLEWHERANKNFNWDGKGNEVYWEPNFGSHVMRSQSQMFRDASVQVSPEGRAATDLGLFWAASANAIPAAGWAVTHIAADSSLLRRIRVEIAPAFSSDSVESVDVTKLNASQLLQSVVAEVLRLRVSALINRTAIAPDFRLGEYKLTPGRVILGSIYFAHRDESIWNTGRTLENGRPEYPIDSFWAERFLEYPDDPFSGPSKKNIDGMPRNDIVHLDNEARFTLDGLNGAYIPFGGGMKMCPGRHYAKHEIYLVVAMMLWEFDFEFRDLESVKKTKANTDVFSVGTLHPDRMNAVKIRRRNKQLKL